MRFTNKVCLVTGAGSGIGRATAIQFASEEGQVVVIDRDDKAVMKQWILSQKQVAKPSFRIVMWVLKMISKRPLVSPYQDGKKLMWWLTMQP